MLVGLTVADATGPRTSIAAPALSISATVGAPLLGGTSRVTIRATNTGDTKGYNLSFDALFGSDLPDPDGRITVGDSSEPPSTVSTDSTTGDTRATFMNVVDLAPGESHEITMEVDLSGDDSWEVGDLLSVLVNGRLNEMPDDSGASLTGSATSEAHVVPIKLVRKSALQSTGVHQATGTEDRAYAYVLEIQNNYVNRTANVVVTDALPDGVEFLGVQSGPALDAGYPQRDPQTGVTQLKWTLGDMAAGASTLITYRSGIRYDYFGTDNGGTNRPTADLSTEPAPGGVIPNKTTFTNTANLTSEYRGSLDETITPTDSATERVTGAYVTLSKSGTPATGGHGTVVNYTLTYHTSQYYTARDLVMRDTLPDGMTYVAGSASRTPTSVTHNADGTTEIVWDPLPTMDPASTASITFQATVDSQWEAAPHAGEPVRAGDSMSNHASMHGEWDDTILDRSEPDHLVAEVDARLSTGLPPIEKQVWDPRTSTWTDHITAQVGDVLQYRLRFNTHNGLTPARTDIALGHIVVTDWLPPGTVYNGDAVPHHSGTFEVPGSGSITAINQDTPNVVTLGSLTGLEWVFGDVSSDGWWETTFTATVVDDPVVAEGLYTGNHWKLTGINTFGERYSDRDIATLDYVEPALVLDKRATSVPDPLVPGSDVSYTISVKNAEKGIAHDVLVTDTLPEGMRQTAPANVSVRLNGTTLTQDTDYTLSYTAATGVWAIDLQNSGVSTPIPAGAEVVIGYSARVDAGVGAGASLRNIATASYNTQPDGSGREVPGTDDVGDPNTDDAVVQLAPLGIVKTWPTGPYTVGDSYTYSIDITVPRGMIAYYPQLIDTLNVDGAYYVDGSATLTDISGAPVAPAAFLSTATPVRGGDRTNNLTTFTWYFANPIDNTASAQDYVFRLSFDVIYTGVRDDGTQEFFVPTANDRATNVRASVVWSTKNSNVPDAHADDDRQNMTTSIVQPLLALDKTTTTSGPYSGNATIGYQVVIENVGWSTAYDLDWSDVLPAHLGSPVLMSITRTVSGVESSIAGDVTSDFTSPPDLAVDFENMSLDPGDSITIRYSAVVDPDVPAATVLTNDSDVDWSSLPGTSDGSRRYNDQSWESGWTRDSDAVSANVSSPTIVKSIIGPSPAPIGSIVQYRLRVTVPAETTLPDSFLTDTISDEGSTFVPGSASVIHVSGAPQTAAAIDSVVVNEAMPNPGATLRFNLVASIDNASPDVTVGDAPYVFDVMYSLLVDGLNDAGGWVMFPPTGNQTIRDTGRLYWTANGTQRNVSSTASLQVIQPLLTLDKTEVSTGPYGGGDTVSYRTVITNVGWANAYDLTWDDLLAPGLIDASLLSVVHSADGDVTALVVSDFTDDDEIAIDFGASVVLAPAQTLTVNYTAEVDPYVGSGSAQTNTADVDWTSMPGVVAGERVYDDSPQEAAWTADTDSATVMIRASGITKQVVGGDLTRTIGEEFEYRVSFSVPDLTTAHRTTLTDVAPDGLTVLSATRSDDIGAVAIGAEVNGETPVVWDLGSVTNPPYGSLSLTLRVRVDDAFYDGSLLDGLPPSIDGDGQSTITNTATLSWYDQAVGGIGHSSDAQTTITIEEPHLAVVKVADVSSAAPGESVTYTVTIINSGTSAAFDLEFEDLVPAALFSAGQSPVLTGVEIDSTPLAAGSDYTASFGSSATGTLSLAVPLQPGSEMTLVYTATMGGGVASGTSLTNAASVTEYRSLPSDATGERVSGPVGDDVTITTRAPQLVISKSVIGDTEVQEGQAVDYRVVVTNIGDAPAYAVRVDDTPAAGLSYIEGSTSAAWAETGSSSSDPAQSGAIVTWAFGNSADLAPGQSLTLDYQMRIGAGTSLDDAINTASSTARDGADWDLPPVSDDAQLLVTEPAVAITKQLAVGQDRHIQVGEQVTFDLIVRNVGSTTITTLPLLDRFDDAYLAYVPGSATVAPDSVTDGMLEWDDLTSAFGAFAPGRVEVISLTFEAISHPAASATENTASIVGAIDEYHDVAGYVTDSAPIGITAPSLSVRKEFTATERSVYQLGTEISFDIHVTNTGDTAISELPLSDVFDPMLLQFVSATPSAALTGPGVLEWDDITTHFGDLAPGQQVTLTVLFKAVDVGEGLNVASVDAGSYDEFDDPVGGDTDSVVFGIYSPDQILFTKTAEPPANTVVLPGDTITYTLMFSNTSTQTIPAVALVDEIPSSVDYVAGSMALAVGGGEPGSLTDDDDSDEGVFDPSAGPRGTVRVSLDGVAAETTVTATFQVVVRPAADSRMGVRNYADASSAGDPIAKVGPIDHYVDPFDITKSARDVNGGRLKPGDEIEWTITVTNTGLVEATNVVVTDDVPLHTTYVAGSIRGRGADDTGAPALRWDIGTMSVGEVVTVTFRSRVDGSVASGTDIRNQAAVRADQSAPKYSDAPGTSAVGDATLLRTGANDWIWLGAAAALLVMAGALWRTSRRGLRRRA